MKTACVLMTALLPTIGHKALIDFSLNMVGPTGRVNVFLSSRSFEPIDGYQRTNAFRETYRYNNQVQIYHHTDDKAPQNPSNLRDWMYWYHTVHKTVEYPGAIYLQYDYVISSEPYGKEMADLLSCEFIPFDMDRFLISAKSSDIRKDILKNSHLILPDFRRRIMQKITFFGQESTGKTTVTQKMNKIYPYRNCMCIHEFARPYLENMDDKSVTHEKMITIAQGQLALQNFGYQNNPGLFIFQDTDLLSTIGYNRIYGGKTIPYLEKNFYETRADLYFVMDDSIPFKPDPLRYGVTKRESDKKFWIDLLDEYKCEYHIIQNPDDVMYEIYEVLDDHINEKFKNISEFERE